MTDIKKEQEREKRHRTGYACRNFKITLCKKVGENMVSC